MSNAASSGELIKRKGRRGAEENEDRPERKVGEIDCDGGKYVGGQEGLGGKSQKRTRKGGGSWVEAFARMKFLEGGGGEYFPSAN